MNSTAGIYERPLYPSLLFTNVSIVVMQHQQPDIVFCVTMISIILSVTHCYEV